MGIEAFGSGGEDQEEQETGLEDRQRPEAGDKEGNRNEALKQEIRAILGNDQNVDGYALARKPEGKIVFDGVVEATAEEAEKIRDLLDLRDKHVGRLEEHSLKILMVSMVTSMCALMANLDTTVDVLGTPVNAGALVGGIGFVLSAGLSGNVNRDDLPETEKITEIINHKIWSIIAKADSEKLGADSEKEPEAAVEG